MRAVRWAEFQALPAGTIYQEYLADYLDRPSVLQEFIRDPDGTVSDWFRSGLLPERSHVHDDVVEWASGVGRDGCYDHDKGQWIVWEAADLERMALWLTNPKAMTTALTWGKPEGCKIAPFFARLG